MTTMQDCSVGLGKETVYGTGVTPTKFPEFLDEKLVWNPTFVQGAGMRVGSRVARASRRAIGKQSAGGDINIEVATKGMGVFFEALFGSATSTAVPGQTGVYQHLFTPTTTDPLPSYTIQKGIPTVGGGATTPMTFNGSVCKSGELSASNGDIVKLKTAWDSREVKTDVLRGPVLRGRSGVADLHPWSHQGGRQRHAPDHDGTLHRRNRRSEHQRLFLLVGQQDR